MTEKLDSYLQKHKGSLVRLLQDLVRIPTVNPPGMNYLDFVTRAKRHLACLGLTTRIVSVPTSYARKFVANADEYPRASLIGRLDVGAPRTIHFNCHYDVVPAAGQWRYGPFEPKVHQGWIYGRGVSDMKGAIASLCLVLQAFKDLKIKPKVNVEVSFTPDEETGGDLGAGYIVRHGHVHADYAVVCEGGSGADVGVGHNGVLWLQAAIAGKAAHASAPEEGINAFEKMAALTMELQPLKARFDKRFFKAPGGRKMHPTINIGGVFGVGDGAKVNTVPAEARFTIDRRITPGEKLRDADKELRDGLRAAGRRIPQLRMSVKQLLAIEPCFVDPAGDLPQAFARAVKVVHRGKTGFGITRGFTDMHFFARDGSIPTIGYGPSGVKAHAIDERTRLADLLQCAKVYTRFLTDWAGE